MYIQLALSLGNAVSIPNVLTSDGNPDPLTNAVAFQSYVDGTDEFSTIFLPVGTVPLGAPIDLGKRNLVGFGELSKLDFTGLSSIQDAVTIMSDTSVRQRAGKISHCVIDMNDTGRDAVRFNGGMGCGATDVQVRNVGRDGFHFEQIASGDYFERAFLEDCEVYESGRYGMCVRLAPFGTGDVQFFNKSRFRDTRFTRCEVADVALLLEDNNGVSNQTKIGGGIKFDNVHAQYNDASHGPNREGCAVYIERAATSDAYIDWITFEDCTFEWNNDDGNADQDGALKIVNNNGSDPVIYDFIDKMTILTGYTRWWDYSGAAAPVRHTYTVRQPQLGTYTNINAREFGTPSSKSGTLNVPAGGTTDLFDATEAGAIWQVTARAAFNTASRVVALVYGHSTPEIANINQAGNLSLQNSGGTIQVANAGGSATNIHWTVTRVSA